MKIEIIEQNNIKIAVIKSKEVIICDTDSALDLIMTVQYDTQGDAVVIEKDAFTEEFFQLSSGVAGEILQKFVTYKTRVAIYGDYSKYISKPWKDFVYECNKGKDIYFVATLEEAVEKLTQCMKPDS